MHKSFWEEYIGVIGLFGLSAVFAILFSSPEDIFRGTIIIDTGLHHKTPNELLAASDFDFYNQSDLERFPGEIEGWKSRDFSQAERQMQALGADVLLLRMYSYENEKIEFILIHSKTKSSFHSPEVCFRANGWEIINKDIEPVNIPEWGSKIWVNKLIVQKGNTKKVILYWYMWGQGITRNNKNCVLTRIEMSFVEDDAEVLGTGKTFIGKLLPDMYKSRMASETIAEQMVDKFGILGAIIDVLLISLPLLMILYTKSKTINRIIKKFRTT